jgi:hypothetical protein
MPLPLFEDKAIEPPTWLRELYVAIPKEDLERLKAWCKHQPHSGSDVVRLLVKAFLEANWPSDESNLDSRLQDCLNQTTPATTDEQSI